MLQPAGEALPDETPVEHEPMGRAEEPAETAAVEEQPVVPGQAQEGEAQ
jgi:hypothetical protein